MEAMQSLGMALFQTSDETIAHDHHLIVIFIGIVAISMAVQAIVVLVGVVGSIGALKKIHAMVHDLHEKTTPVLVKTHALLNDISPKVSSIATNITEITETVREKSDEISETISRINITVNDVNLRTRGHVAHADRIVGSALDTTEEFKDVIADGIRGPLKQVAGIIAGFRAGLETLISGVGKRW